MKIDLADDEIEYLKSAMFWDWKRAELDLQLVKTSKVFYDEVRELELEEKVEWYKTLWKKLKGDEDEKNP